MLVAKESLLYVSFPGVPFVLPKVVKSGGGIATLERFILSVLCEDYDVTILAPKDSVIHPDWQTPVILGDHRSKVECGKIEGAKVAKKVFDLAPQFGKVFLNDFRIGSDLKSWLNIAPKCYFINHCSMEEFTSSFNVTQYHLSYLLAKGGAKVAHVQERAEEELAEFLPRIKKNPYILKDQPVGLYGEDFHFINMRVTDDLFYQGEVTLGNHWAIMGGSDYIKAIPQGIKAWQKADIPGELWVFTQKTQQKRDLFEEISSLAENDPRVRLFVNQERDVIVKGFLSARGCIFPSRAESMGLVALEANLTGNPVIYTHPNTGSFLSKVPHNVFVPKRTVKLYAEAIRQVEESISLSVKETVRSECLRLYSKEASKESLRSFVSL